LAGIATHSTAAPTAITTAAAIEVGVAYELPDPAGDDIETIHADVLASKCCASCGNAHH
jgi:hypothetical protein